MTTCRTSKVRKGAGDDQGTSKKPSAFFWQVETASADGKGTSRKKNSSGGVSGVKQKVQACTEASKENKVPKVDKHSHQRRPSLKELCPEDKHRVRLLIEQLAKTSCEKEAMEDQVKEERKQFAMLLEKLKKQHHKVVKEKKDSCSQLESELHASQLQLQSMHTYTHSSHLTSISSSVDSAPPLSTAAFAGGSTTPSLTSPIQTYPPPVGPITGHMTSSIAPALPPTTTSFIGSTSSCPPTSAYHVTSSGTSPTVSAAKTVPFAPVGGVNSTKSSQLPNVVMCDHPAPQTNNSLPPPCQHHHNMAPPSVHATYPEYFDTPTTAQSTLTQVQRKRSCVHPIFTETVGQVSNNEACPPRLPDSVASGRERNPPSSLVDSSVCNCEVQRRSLGYPPNRVASGDHVPRNVSYPPSFAEYHFGNSEVQYPPSLTESLSTTTVNQGFPLSSTHMQRPQQECRYQPDAVLHSCTHRTSNDDANMFIPGMVLSNSDHNCKESHSGDHQASHDTKILGDRANHTNVTASLLTPSQAAMPRSLSLPSASEGDSLTKKEQSKRSREVGTQTLNVETVATQTSNMDEYQPDHVINEPDHVTKELLHMSSSQSNPSKKRVHSKAVSAGDPLSTVTDSPWSLGHHTKESPPELIQSDLDEDTSMEDLLTTSDLLNSCLGLSGRLSSSQQPMDFNSTSKGHSMIVSISEPLDYSLAVYLNSHGYTSPLPLHNSSSSILPSHPSSLEHINLTSGDSTPSYTNYPYYGDCQTDREKKCLDDSSLIEQLFFI